MNICISFRDNEKYINIYVCVYTYFFFFLEISWNILIGIECDIADSNLYLEF